MAATPPEPDIITVTAATAGKMLGLSPWQVKGLCEKGLLEFGYSGRTLLVKVESVYAYAESLPTERPAS